MSLSTHNNILTSKVDIDVLTEAVAKHCRNLMCLDVSGADGQAGVSDIGLMALCERAHNLVRLNLANCSDITDDGLVALLLAARGGAQVQKPGEARVASPAEGECKAPLIHLDLTSCSNITDRTLQSIAECCPLLQHLDLSYCQKITNTGVRSLADGCSKLQYLSLWLCFQISDIATSYVAASCPSLRVLDLFELSRVGDDTLIELGRSAHNLQELTLHGCTSVTDDGIQAIAAGCPFLRTIDLARCNGVSIVGLLDLVESCSQLARVDLRQCSEGVDDEVLGRLVSSISSPPATESAGRGLVELDIGECGKVTDSGLGSLAKGECCKSLEALNLESCQLVTSGGVGILCSKAPYVLTRYTCRCISRTFLTTFAHID